MSTISASTTSTTAYTVTADTTGTLVLQTGASPTTAATIGTTGNIGVGIVDNANIRLQVKQAVDSDVGGIGFTSVDGTVTSVISALNAGAMTFRNAGAERMRIDSSGNVGIGTSSPAYRLDVQGSDATTGVIRVKSTGSGAQATVFLDGYASGGTYRASRLDFAQGGTVKKSIIYDYNQNNTADLSFCNSAGTREMILDASGNLLVGTTTAANSAMLCVAGTVSASFTGRMYSLGTYNNTTASATNMHIASDGHIFRSTSSLKYKTNVQDASHGLIDLMKLRAVTYEGKAEADSGKRFGGLIAEEVHQAGLTEFVQYADDGTPDALAYGHMVSLCIKAIQELKAELDAAKADIATLKGAA